MATDRPQGLAHMVYFSLKDCDEAMQAAFVAACKKYLSDHPGVVHFSVGTRAQGYDRPVNDADHDVAVHLVFASEADHDRYQASERHQQFLAEQSKNWSQVRIFDALI
ncbi:MAG: Dabb family protein [Pirellulales bacterium]|nr:Dabb family protein [Pirellulales bacterium]